jgi:hypothetical protein
MKAIYFGAVVVAILAGGCAHDAATSYHSTRGEPVGVNSYSYSTATIDTRPTTATTANTAVTKSMPVTGAVSSGISASPSTMATTTSSGDSR